MIHQYVGSSKVCLINNENINTYIYIPFFANSNNIMIIYILKFHRFHPTGLAIAKTNQFKWKSSDRGKVVVLIKDMINSQITINEILLNFQWILRRL